MYLIRMVLRDLSRAGVDERTTPRSEDDDALVLHSVLAPSLSHHVFCPQMFSAVVLSHFASPPNPSHPAVQIQNFEFMAGTLPPNQSSVWLVGGGGSIMEFIWGNQLSCIASFFLFSLLLLLILLPSPNLPVLPLSKKEKSKA